jgi:hypothetical protein
VRSASQVFQHCACLRLRALPVPIDLHSDRKRVVNLQHSSSRVKIYASSRMDCSQACSVIRLQQRPKTLHYLFLSWTIRKKEAATRFDVPAKRMQAVGSRLSLQRDLALHPVCPNKGCNHICYNTSDGILPDGVTTGYIARRPSGSRGSTQRDA